MSKAESGGKEGFAERNTRRLRNFKVMGALAFAGVGVLAPGIAVPMDILAAWHVAEAGGLEVGRRHLKKKRTGSH